MERCFDALQAAAQSDPTTLYSDSALKESLSQLLQYYENGQWLCDYELDEQGGLPEDLKRGVLSQDAIFDFLAQIRDAKE